MEIRPNQIISTMVSMEQNELARRPGQDKENNLKETKLRVGLLFLLVVLGILASWFWEIAWAYLANPESGLVTGSFLSIIVRVLLAFIIAALTFSNIYMAIKEKEGEQSAALFIFYLIAFQNGFFWDALLKTVQSSFNL